MLLPLQPLTAKKRISTSPIKKLIFYNLTETKLKFGTNEKTESWLFVMVRDVEIVIPICHHYLSKESLQSTIERLRQHKYK